MFLLVLYGKPRGWLARAPEHLGTMTACGLEIEDFLPQETSLVSSLTPNSTSESPRV